MVRGTHWFYTGKGYVTADGNYGGDELIVFERDALTEKQWDLLGELSDSSRIDYTHAILNGEDVSEYED